MRMEAIPTNCFYLKEGGMAMGGSGRRELSEWLIVTQSQSISGVGCLVQLQKVDGFLGMGSSGFSEWTVKCADTSFCCFFSIFTRVIFRKYHGT